MAQRHQVQRIFTDLVHLGNENQQQPNSRQRKQLVTLCRTESEFKSVEYIVQQLIQARLLVKNKETVEIIHDVLLNEWEYLKSWIKDNRAYLEWHQQLKEKFQNWEQTNLGRPRKRDAHKLLAGSDLTQAASYLKRYKDDLTTQDQFFIRMSQKRQLREVNTWRAVGLVLLVLLLLAGGMAEWAWLNLQQTQVEKRVALAHALVAQANTYLLKHQFDMAMLLSVKAYQTVNDYDTRDALLTALEGSSQVDKILHDNNIPPNPLQHSMAGLAFSTDGQMLISARADGRVVLWNTTTGELHPVHIPIDELGSIVLSTQGKLAATAGPEGLWLWDAQAGVQLTRLSDPLVEPMDDAPPFTFSPDEHILAVRDGKGGLVLWDTVSRKPLGTLLTGLSDFEIGYLAFSADDKLLALSVCKTGNQTLANGGNPLYCGQSDILLWDVASKTRIGSPLRSSQVGVRSIAFSPDGRLLATGGTDNTVVLWDVTTQQPLGEPLPGHTQWVDSLTFSPDGNLLASGSRDHTVRLWDVPVRKEVGDPLLGHQGDVSSVTFSADGQYLASSSDDDTMIIWNVTSNSHLSQPLNLKVTSDPHAGFSSGPFADSFAYSEPSSPYNVNGIYLYNVKTGTSTNLFSGQMDTGNFALSSNLRTLAAYGEDGTITLWNMRTNKPTQHFKDPSPQDGHIALSSDSRTLATCCDTNRKTLTVWDVATGHIIRRISSHDQIYTMAISPDGQMIASGDSAGTVTLWNVTTGVGQSLTDMGKVVITLFSPDGKILAARSSNGTLFLWDITEQKRLDSPPITNDPEFPSTGMAFSPDEDILALASGPIGTSITLWDLKRHELVAHPLSGSSTEDLIFGLDGHLLSTTNIGHGVVYLSFTLWDINIDSWMDRACRITNRNLTTTEWNQFASGEPYRKVCPNLPS